MKYIVIILDGAADWPLSELGGRTCLQVASTPNLDEMALTGKVGLAQTVPAGTEPSSSAACMSILGYDPVANYIGRGAIEAANLGIKLAEDEVALRLNFVTIVDGFMRSYCGGHISTEESRAIVTDLAAALDDGTFRLYPGIGYRHILVVAGHPELLDAKYTAPHDIPDRPVAESFPRGQGTDLLLDYMRRARPILENSIVNRYRVDSGKAPITDVWPFWPGVAPEGMTSFSQRNGVVAAMTSGVGLLGGLAVLVGIERLSIPGVTDGLDNDYRAQAIGALAALDTHDLVIIHVESPDEAAHSGDVAGKIASIEAIDRDIVSRVCSLQDVRVLVMPDHPTPIALRTHVGEPVPFVLWGSGIEADGVSCYDEMTAATTGLYIDPGYDIMSLLLGR